MSQWNNKQANAAPSVRKIRRACNRELFRTIKKLKLWIPPEQVEQAEKIYFQKVLMHFPYVVENNSNRKLLAEWWEEHVCAEVAVLWNVEPPVLAKAFREAFGT